MAMERLKVNPAKVNDRPFYHVVKRLFDIVASACGLILLFPLFLFLVIKIRSEDGGPAFYSQERIGKNEKPFKMWKFRSMVVDADKMLDKLEDQNEIDGAMFKIKDDPRVTKIGHVIRKYSLDELPQLWNVLIGDMSLVGPRPEVSKWVAVYPHLWDEVLSVKPGITDNASILYRNEEHLLAMAIDPEDTYKNKILPEKLQLYLKYVNEQSLKLYDEMKKST